MEMVILFLATMSNMLPAYVLLLSKVVVNVFNSKDGDEVGSSE